MSLLDSYLDRQAVGYRDLEFLQKYSTPSKDLQVISIQVKFKSGTEWAHPERVCKYKNEEAYVSDVPTLKSRIKN